MVIVHVVQVVQVLPPVVRPEALEAVLDPGALHVRLPRLHNVLPLVHVVHLVDGAEDALLRAGVQHLPAAPDHAVHVLVQGVVPAGQPPEQVRERLQQRPVRGLGVVQDRGGDVADARQKGPQEERDLRR